MNVRVIARESTAFTGRKCSLCHKVARPGHTVITDGRLWVAHRVCLAEFLKQSYEAIPNDGAPALRRTRQEKEEEAQQRADDRFAEYRKHLLQRFGIKE